MGTRLLMIQDDLTLHPTLIITFTRVLYMSNHHQQVPEVILYYLVLQDIVYNFIWVHCYQDNMEIGPLH